MKLTVLVDNNTIIDKYLYAEPAVSYYIEDEGTIILFDTGYSELFIKNAKLLQKDLNCLDFVALSHGHNDHTGGLVALQGLIKNKKQTACIDQNVKIVAHPDVFLPREENNQDIGSPIQKTQLEKDFEVTLSSEPYWMSKNMVFLGEVPRLKNFENKTPIGKIWKSGVLQDDYVLDDSAIVYNSKLGLVIVTGCSHAGICNIIEYAKIICSNNTIASVVGGFHLLSPSKKEIEGTLQYFKKLKVETIYPCHCTGFKCKVELANFMNVEEVGVSMELNFP